MNPEQKEAWDRLNWHVRSGGRAPSHAEDIRTILDALAASQPTPVADTKRSWRNLAFLRIKALEEGPRSAKKDFAIEELRFLLNHAPAHPAPLDADTGQTADEVEALRKVLYAFVQGDGDFMEARRLLGERTYAAADTGQAVAIDWECRDDMMRVRREARRLWREDHGSCSWSEENRDCYMIRAAISLAHPAPLDAERVRELEDRLREITDACEADCGVPDDDDEDDEAVGAGFDADGVTIRPMALTFGIIRRARALLERNPS